MIISCSSNGQDYDNEIQNIYSEYNRITNDFLNYIDDNCDFLNELSGDYNDLNRGCIRELDELIENTRKDVSTFGKTILQHRGVILFTASRSLYEI